MDSEKRRPRRWGERQRYKSGVQISHALKMFFQFGFHYFRLPFLKVYFHLFQNLVDLAGSERAAQTGAEGNENSCSVGLNVFPFYRIKSASMHFRN